MSSTTIYLDESGDLGWSFDKPYRQGGSSRFLTIGSLVVSGDKGHHPGRVIKELYEKYRWKTTKEKKWADMHPSQRINFAQCAHKLADRFNEIKYFTITVRKEKVQSHIRTDENKLYNYMIRLLLIQEMAKYSQVTFKPDTRTVKVESQNSLHDYLQIALWFDIGVSTKLATKPCDSSCNRNVQFADMLAGLVQSHYEDDVSEPYRILTSRISNITLFF